MVDITNYVFSSIQKTFSNRETPIGKAPILVVFTLVALWLLHCMLCKEMRGRYRSVRIVQYNVIESAA